MNLLTWLNKFCFLISGSYCKLTFRKTHTSRNQTQRELDTASKYYDRGKLVSMVYLAKRDWPKLLSFSFTGRIQPAVTEFCKWWFGNNHTSRRLRFSQTEKLCMLHIACVAIYVDTAAMIHC